MQAFNVITYKTRLIDARKRKGLSQKEAAEKLNVQRTTYSTWEQEQKTSYPNLEMLFQLCSLYDVSADYLLGLTDSITPVAVTPVSIAPLSIPRSEANPLEELAPDLRSKAEGYIDSLLEQQKERSLEIKKEEKA